MGERTSSEQSSLTQSVSGDAERRAIMTAAECSWAPRAAARRKRRAVAIGSVAIGSVAAAESAAARRRGAAAAKGIRLKRERRPKSAAVTNLLSWLGG